MEEKNIDVLMEYAIKFGNFPPLLYGLDLDDDVVIKVAEKALKRGKPATLDDYPDDVGERVVTGFNSND